MKRRHFLTSLAATPVIRQTANTNNDGLLEKVFGPKSCAIVALKVYREDKTEYNRLRQLAIRRGFLRSN